MCEARGEFSRSIFERSGTLRIGIKGSSLHQSRRLIELKKKGGVLQNLRAILI